ncbi:MAG: glutamyl-tRNA amidotransferase [Cyanobacteria bacterium P01_H01_bin.162]
MTETLKLAVNGTLMRGLALNPNLLNVGATFNCVTTTEPAYRLWTIDDQYPAMVRVAEAGVAIAVEVWDVPLAGLGVILMQEPPGLAICKVKLAEGETVLGVIGEPLTVVGKREITEFGGWRAYQASLAATKS